MQLDDYLGKTITTTSGKVVLVEDTYPRGRVCGRVIETGEFIVLSLDFVEVDMTEEKAKWNTAPSLSLLNSLRQDHKLNNEYTKIPTDDSGLHLVYAVEHVCGGNDAAGGGCGAPLGVRVCGKFQDNTFKVKFDFVDHNDSEVDSNLVKARDEGLLRLRYLLRPCSGCLVK